MPKINFDYLNIMKQKRFKNKGFKMKENNGLDTETYQGCVKLICADVGTKQMYKEINCLDDCLKFLTHHQFKDSYNWFYNIQFDFESIIKYLDEIDLRTLYHEKTVYYKDYRITYLPKKFFAILDKNNHYYYFYDLYNFLDTSLDKASKKFLKDKKISTIDGNLLNTSLEYWKQNREEIILYCKKDANLTKRLADYFWKLIYQNLNYYPKSPMSKGKLSEEYFLQTCNIPSINTISSNVLKIGYESFYGGRFELLKRGYFEKVYAYDISSAYPYQMTKLPDFTKGEWRKVSDLNEDAYTGFYKCKINCLEENFSPFKLKLKAGLNIYPNGTINQYLAKQEIDFFRLRFPNNEITIEFGWEWYPKSLVYPLKQEIERLYQWKEKEQDVDIKYCIKIILNSLYGKFIQVSGEENKTGKLFNPLYAALITAGCRIKILEMALNKPDDIISFSTDSVMSMAPLPYPKNPQIGDFKFEFNGEGIFVMSDVYNLWNDETKKVKSKIRGFSISSVKDFNADEIYLRDMLKDLQDTEYHYESKRPYHLGECLIHRKTKSVKDINIFGIIKKSIDVNGDNKRVWEKEFKNGNAVFKEMHESIPLLIED